MTWIIIQPLLGAGVFSFVFGRVAGLSSDHIPYLVYSFVGLLGWNIFSSTVSKASGSLTGNTTLVSKVAFPRQLLPLSTVASTLTDFIVAAALLLILFPVYGVDITWRVALLPVPLALVLLLSLGVGFIGAATNVRYRDVGYILPLALQLLLFISPIAYSLDSVPARYRFFERLNPLTDLLELFRWSLFNRLHVGLLSFVYAAVVAVAVFVIGALVFNRLERGFADVI